MAMVADPILGHGGGSNPLPGWWIQSFARVADQIRSSRTQDKLFIEAELLTNKERDRKRKRNHTNRKIKLVTVLLIKIKINKYTETTFKVKTVPVKDNIKIMEKNCVKFHS